MSCGSYIHQAHCRSLLLELCVVCTIVNQCYQMELEVVKQLTTSSARDTLITVHSCINSMHPSSIAAALNNDLSCQLFFFLLLLLFSLFLTLTDTVQRCCKIHQFYCSYWHRQLHVNTHTHTNNNF